MPAEKEKIPAAEEAKAWGIDLSLIEANLKRTPTERIEVLQQTLDMIFELRRGWDDAQRQNNPAKVVGK